MPLSSQIFTIKNETSPREDSGNVERCPVPLHRRSVENLGTGTGVKLCLPDAPRIDTDPTRTVSAPSHMQLTVKAARLDGTRLNLKKADLQRRREGIAEALREHGIEATTTSRIHRTTQER